MAENTKTEKTRRIMFPTLIQQVLLFQRIIPPDTCDDEFTGLPKLVVKDIKAGRGSGADSSTASLEEDIKCTIASLKAIRGETMCNMCLIRGLMKTKSKMEIMKTRRRMEMTLNDVHVTSEFHLKS
ncbi:hypothetical protein DY000_02010681 [Brassica cretica]|uniref:Uncharacterized protein n=1 Tax=Brassica cretica TaxID=69181 RepID=A0ABQ7CHE1_BRACR|nr:hypothetical protein DY000_02010681 [Brassica cretica]